MEYAGDENKRVRTGGPVQPEQGLVLYGEEHADPEGQRVQEGLEVSTSRGTLARLCSLSGGRFQCFSGYAGWGPGQLEREMQEGAWLALPHDLELAFTPKVDDLWQRCFERLGIDPVLLSSPSGRLH